MNRATYTSVRANATAAMPAIGQPMFNQLMISSLPNTKRVKVILTCPPKRIPPLKLELPVYSLGFHKTGIYGGFLERIQG